MSTRPAVQASTAVSIFIISYNEEKTIAHCLESVGWSNDIVILDSYSTDATAEIARSHANVRFYQRSFKNFSDQRNYGLHAIAFANPWVFIIDADEIMEDALRAEIRSKTQNPRNAAVDVFLLRRHVKFQGRVLRRNTTSSFWIGRLVQPKRVSYEGSVHERLKFAGPFGKLQGRLVHDQFSKGLDHWHARSARYASLEGEAQRDAKIKDLFSADPLERRALLKKVFYSVPGAWMGYLMFNVLAYFAFLDGWRGVRYVYLQAQYHKLTAQSIRRSRDARTR